MERFITLLRWPAAFVSSAYALHLMGSKAAEWIWLFVYNLRWPMLVAALVVGVISIFVVDHAENVRKRTAFGAPENTDAKWRQLVSVQLASILLAASVILFAIPKPNYDVKLVPGPERIVKVNVPGPVQWKEGKQIVVQPSSYDAEYIRCINDVESRVERRTATEVEFCHNTAKTALDNQRVAPTVVIKDRVVHDPYQKLFDNCNDRYSFDGIPAAQAGALRNERITLCHKAALEGAGQRE